MEQADESNYGDSKREYHSYIWKVVLDKPRCVRVIQG